MLRVVIAGATGRMGNALLEGVFADGDFILTGALDRTGSPELGRDAGLSVGKVTGIHLTDNIEEALKNADVLIDFTRPEASMQYLPVCLKGKIRYVIGTTGFTQEQKAAITKAASEIPIVFAPNMSVGVTLLLNLVEQAAKILHDGYDIEVVEMHHRYKVDAPSGTALRLGEAAAKGLGQDLKDCAIYAREGVTGEREAGKIGFATMRGGDVVGDHTVVFAGVGERVEITHKASSRATFALGALRAAKYLADKPSGLYDMQDVLGFSKS